MGLFAIEKISDPEQTTRASTAIFLLLCVIPVFATIAFGGVDNLTWILFWISAIALVVLWLLDTRSEGGLVFSPERLQLPLLALILIGAVQCLPVGTINFPDQGVTVWRHLSIDPTSTVFFVYRLIVYLIFFAAALIYINSPRRVSAVVRMIVIFGPTMAFFSILQRLSGAEGIYGLRPVPNAIPLGPFVNQHHFAALMEMTTGVALGLFLGPQVPKDKKTLLAIAIVIMGAGLLVTSSRGGVLGFLSMASLAGFLSFTARRRAHGEEKSSARTKAGVALAAAGILFVMIGLVVFIGGNDYLLRGVGVDVAGADFSTGRVHFWPVALRIFLDHPLIGAGFNAFGDAFTRYDSWNGALRVEQAHNDYLQTLADAGILGFAAVVAFIYLLFRSGLRRVFDAHNQMRDVAIGSLAGCFGIMVHSVFDFPLRTPADAFFFLLLCVLATTRVKTSKPII